MLRGFIEGTRDSNGRFKKKLKNSPILKIELAICSHYKVLPTSDEFKKLNWFQKLALHQGIVDHNKNINDTIIAVVESLKPWLNTEAYFKIKEYTENERPNSRWGIKDAG